MNFLLNVFTGFTTLFAATIAIILFYWERNKKKQDAARIIVQEIRRAEDVIKDYKEYGGYKFTKKIIATNSWAKNIHHFVNNLDQDEIDKISNLYSTGEYLDSIILKISDVNFDEKVKHYKKELEQFSQEIQYTTQEENKTTSGEMKSGFQNIKPPKVINIPISIPPPWKNLLDDITYKYESIYHSSICDKLKRIAKLL
ncbi:hypothetical protein ACFL23_02785 [Patescibacteria group bacterium]